MAAETKSTLVFQKWPDTLLVNKLCHEKNRKTKDKVVTYRAKIKLHGCNAAITIQNGQMGIQSRTQFDDRPDFLLEVIGSYQEYFKTIPAENGFQDQVVTIYGELCGRKVQSKVALAQLTTKIFAIFAIVIGDNLIAEPSDITAIITRKGTRPLPEQVYILPWYRSQGSSSNTIFTLPLSEQKQCASILEPVEKMVAEIEAVDPWVQQVFGIKGRGEGLVMYPTCDPTIAATTTTTPTATGTTKRANTGLVGYDSMKLETFAYFGFKVKGKSFATVDKTTPAQTTLPMASGVQEFANLVVTEPRLEQMLRECAGVGTRATSEFIRLVQNDVHKECKPEMENAGLEWVQVQTVIGRLASAWYLKKLKEIKETQSST